MTKKKINTETELDKRCREALARVNKHINKLVTRHLKEIGLAGTYTKK